MFRTYTARTSYFSPFRLPEISFHTVGKLMNLAADCASWNENGLLAHFALQIALQRNG